MSAPPAGSFTTRRFRPQALLGRGTMGIVYRAYDQEIGCDVALKTLCDLEPDQIYRLKREFRMLANITHPNLVELHELIVTDGACFFTMELIEGVGFLAHVRGENGSRYARLREDLRQLACGLAALHAGRKLHRDVKPSNIMVTPQGRVVLLDFGLATALAGEDPRRADGREMVGTFSYMAPEQSWGTDPHPSGDAYSLGVVLYEALTGRLPFEGSPLEVLQAKEAGHFAAPRAVVSDVPALLDELVRALLDPEPGRRPLPEDVLQALETDSPVTPAARPRRRGGTPFVGRGAELASLRTAFARVRSAGAAVVHLHGTSGIGKTELVRHFARALERDEGALVLRGRCYPHESVPYKALDSIIDALSRVLLARPELLPVERAPASASALVRLFPVLGRVPALAQNGASDPVADPHEVRRGAFEALRELLKIVAETQPLALCIDDLQWGDLDSALLLRDLVLPPAPPAVLLVLAYRSEDRQPTSFLRLLEGGAEGLAGVSVDEIELGPLSPAESQRLAALLCADAPVVQPVLDRIADESAGSPFFLSELSRHFCAGPARADTAPGASRRGLAEVVHGRIEHLSPHSRRILEIVSVAGRPIERSVALRAAEVGEPGRSLIATLSRASLLRPTFLGDAAAVEMYHDRMRELIIEGLAAETLRQRHREIAEVLRAAPHADPHALLQHYLGAGMTQLAGEYALQAAELAARALAFDRAAALYRQALELGASAGDEASLHLGLAEALVNAGRGGEAARSFETAADVLARQSFDSAAVMTLRRRAAEQLLRAGHFDEGTARMRAVLATLGVRLPKTSRRALAVSLVQRARLMVGGTDFVRRGRARVSSHALLRLDACWAASTGLLGVDPIVADGVGVRCLIESLAVGEPSRVIRALGLEAIREAALGMRLFQRRSVRLLERAEDIAGKRGDAYDEGWLAYCKGASAYFGARWWTARAECDASVAVLRARCRGVAWEIVTGESFALTALAHKGALRELAARLPGAINDGDQRGDVYAATSLRMGMPATLWLAQDRPEDARALADDAVARWPATTFLVQHYLHLIATVQADLYRGDVWSAWQRVRIAWPKLRRAHIVSDVAVARIEVRHLHARAALAAAASDPARLPAGATPPDPDWPRARLLRVARRDAQRLAREHLPSARPYAEVIRAGLAYVADGARAAVPVLALAADLFANADMALHAAAVRHREGGLRGGDAGAALRAESEAWMRAETIENPAAMAEMLAPGISASARA